MKAYTLVDPACLYAPARNRYSGKQCRRTKIDCMLLFYARSGASKMPGGEDKYHWSFLVGPKNESTSTTGRRCHAKESMKAVAGAVQNVWEFEDRQISLLPTSAILVRVLIGKVTDQARLRDAFARTPIRAGHDGYDGWNCATSATHNWFPPTRCFN